MNQKVKLHPRKWDITGEGMSSGYLIGEGAMYIKYDSDMIKHLREIEKEKVMIIKNTERGKEIERGRGKESKRKSGNGGRK